MRALCTCGLTVAVLACAASADVFVANRTVFAGGTSFSTLTGVIPGQRLTMGVFQSNASTYMRLIDPASTTVAADDVGGYQTQSAIRHTALLGGTYGVEVTGFPDPFFSGSPFGFDFALVVSNGATGIESLGNDTLAGATALDYGTAGAAMDGALSAGDVDFYSFSVPGAAYVTAQIDDFGDGNLDTLVGLFDSSGTLLAYNDDGGRSSGYNSVLEFAINTPGTYYWGVTGYPDINFRGEHTMAGAYRLVASGGFEIPAPGAAAVLGLAGLAAARRRRP